MTRNEAYVVLNSLPLIGPIRVRQLLQVFATPEAILAASAHDLTAVSGIGPKASQALVDWRERVDLARELQLAEEAGVEIISVEDADYPQQLKEIKDPPLVLYIKGDRDALRMTTERGLAVVGSRRTTMYGDKLARNLTAAAVQAGWVIVSGLARGIDTIAHQTTVDNDGRTIAVLGGGMLQVSPPENIPLATAICKNGCVITEQPMNMRPDKRTFPMRNRIIAALCPGTLVVEAGRGSGSLITAEKAFAFNKKVFAVPGRVDSPQSQGCNDLIRQGAKLTASLDDIATEFSILPGLASAMIPEATESKPVQPVLAIDLSPDETAICQALEPGEAGIDELVGRCGQPVHRLLSTLMGLELKRVVRQGPGKRFALNN